VELEWLEVGVDVTCLFEKFHSLHVYTSPTSDSAEQLILLRKTFFFPQTVFIFFSVFDKSCNMFLGS
jgi:hypothetical protein